MLCKQVKLFVEVCFTSHGDFGSALFDEMTERLAINELINICLSTSLRVKSITFSSRCCVVLRLFCIVAVVVVLGCSVRSFCFSLLFIRDEYTQAHLRSETLRL